MDVYENLRKILDSHPTGCPEDPDIIGILKILFTEEEAQTALGLGFRPFDVETVSKRSGVEPEKAALCLESLADKGVVFARKKNGKMRYALTPIMPGIFEFPFMKGEENKITGSLRPLWKRYLPLLAKGFGSPSMAFSRIIPIGKALDSQPDVLPYEEVYQMIENASSTGIARCACREMEQNCDNPKEACMIFDETCDFLVERGFARYLSKEEMKEKLREFDAKGLIHQINNAMDRLTFVCNCCTCCCGLLRAKIQFGNPNVLNTSGFLPVWDAEKCALCGVCTDERCPVNALSMEEETISVDPDACIGCGLCVTGCPENAISMTRREGVNPPAKTNRDMGLVMLEEQGRLGEFLKYLDPDAALLAKK